MKYSAFYITTIILLISTQLYSIDYKFHESLNWQQSQKAESANGEFAVRPVFEGSIYNNDNILPHFNKNYRIHTANATVQVRIEQAVYELMDPVDMQSLLPSKESLKKVIPSASVIKLRKEPWISVDMVPIRWNDSLKGFEKLISFDLIAEITEVPELTSNENRFANQSVLASGSWHKIRVTESGIYKVSYSDLQAMGFDMNTKPGNISLFGNGGGILPEKNDDPVYDDLVENPIQMVDGDDGSFDEGDYFLFYAQGPVIWKWNTFNEAFYHINNYYDNYAYYFITALKQPGKRIQNLDAPDGQPAIETNEFIDYAYHEEDTHNLGNVGRVWYGEQYDLSSLTYDFIFSFPNIIKSSKSGFFRANFAANASGSSHFLIDINGTQMTSVSVEATSGNYDFGKEANTSFRFLPKDDNILVSTTYQRSDVSSVGYLDYIEVNVHRALSMSGNQMRFRNVYSEDGLVAKYQLNNASSETTIWDITTPVNAGKVITQLNGSQLTFKGLTSTINEYIAFNNSDFKTVEFVEQITNQNLHAIRNIDYLIVCHPDFLDQANRLAEFHRTAQQLKVEVVTVNQIYNEFSSGAQDISAIRNFAKMLYDESDPGAELKYMLLFGDASYDYKDRISDNTNFVPCWVSLQNPLDIINSIASDDYFGFLNDGEGIEGSNSDRVDIGIGRFVVANEDEARDAVDKTIHYSTNAPSVMGSWRNVITFIADDEDSNIHLNDAEFLTNYVGTNFPVYNINKIYVDAYKQISTPGGQKAPDVNQAINLQMNKGTLIFNYSGHGGEIGLGHEQYVQITDINSWSNYNSLTVFITATCEFTRYDDPHRVSAGEQVFLNNKGGAIALFTTARPTYAAANRELNMAIYQDNMFIKIDGQYPTFGDIIRKSKERNTANGRKFILVGDPACRMVYPELNAETTQINGLPVGEEPDTLRALDMVTIDGRITDRSGTHITDFKGDIYPIVYDKLSEIVTYGDHSSPKQFYVRKNVLFNGKASILSGKFSFEFMMPKDIAYQYGPGKISYYFKNETTDGNGIFENFIVGGTNPEAKEDTMGPVIDLYLFDTTFKSGSIINQNPLLFAKVSDESGINTTGSGIGHDIVSTLDDDANQAYVLNDFYEANQNRFNSGTISYPFDKLADGEHVLSLKVWDVHNNSSIAYLPFVVVSSEKVIIDHLHNFPNPFSETTNFAFTHNQAGNELDVVINIYRLDGSIVKTLNTKINPEGYQSDPLEWDGKADGGGQLNNGFYVYRMVIRNQDGQTGEDSSKLIYVK